MFKMVIQGRLVEDAQVQQSKDGQSTYLSFRIAVNTFENKTNKAYFISVSSFNYNNSIVPYLKKGSSVEVIGTPRVSAYLNRQNQPMYDIHVTADSVDFASTNSNNKSQDETTTTQSNEPKNASEPEHVEEQIIMTTSNTAKRQSEPNMTTVTVAQNEDLEENDDDLPF